MVSLTDSQSEAAKSNRLMQSPGMSSAHLLSSPAEAYRISDLPSGCKQQFYGETGRRALESKRNYNFDLVQDVRNDLKETERRHYKFVL